MFSLHQPSNRGARKINDEEAGETKRKPQQEKLPTPITYPAAKKKKTRARRSPTLLSHQFSRVFDAVEELLCPRRREGVVLAEQHQGARLHLLELEYSVPTMP